MDKHTPISLEERKKIQLEMLDEIHSFCKRNNIRYSLAFGTLLGAIRHKGFIPWDDDVDIMMPLPDLLRFKKEFRSEKIQYHDVDNDKCHPFAFSLLSYKTTYRDIGMIYKGTGVSIDLYICIGLPDKSEEFIAGAMPLFKKRITAIKYRAIAIKKLPVNSIPFFSYIQKQYRDYLFNKSIPYEQAEKYYIIAAALDQWKTTTYDYDLFEELIETPFENHHYQITAHYDAFLRLRYDDYMQYPPIEQQVPAHGKAKFYWK